MPAPQAPQAATAMRTVNMAPVKLEARAMPETYNADNRTVDVTFSTGARVLRFNWDVGYYFEELDMSEGAIRMDRLTSGKAPVLDTHASYELSNQIGVVVSAKIENGIGTATLRFSSREDIAGIIQDIKDGIICNVSIGYRTHKLVMVEDAGQVDGSYPIYRATDWEPHEISMVPIPADAEAGTRDAGKNTNPCQISARTLQTKGEPAMDTKNPAQNAETAANTPTPEQERQAATAAERTRAVEIGNLCEKHGMDAEFKRNHIEKGTSLEDVRSAILDKLAANTASTQTRGGVTAEVKGEQMEKRADAMTQALMHRVDPITYKMEGDARDFMGMTLFDMARDYVEVVLGKSTRGLTRQKVALMAMQHNSERAGGSHTTSDFANILAAVVNKSLRAKYDVAPQTFRPFTRVTTTPDYKLINRMQLGEAPVLLPVNEAGEYEYGTIKDGKEVYQVAKFGRIVRVTDEIIINDDLDALTRLPEAFGDQAAILINKLVWSQIINNPTMGDGVALFHANHGNLVTGAGSVLSASDLSGLNQMRALLRRQMGVDGVTPLNLNLGMVAVPPALETEAEKIIKPIAPTQAGNVNPYAGKLGLIVEPLLETVANGDKMWYGFADGRIDRVELAFLEGTGQGPVVETKNGWEVDGVEIKCKVVAGAKAIDSKGMVRANGQ